MQPWFIIFSMLAIATLVYFIIKEREKQLQRQADLRKERIESQFELLKSQINPHFLFNNFNTLVALIEEDDGKHAIEYVERLSDFYRSILHYREKDVIKIQEEFDIGHNKLLAVFIYTLRKFVVNFVKAVQNDLSFPLRNV